MPTRNKRRSTLKRLAVCVLSAGLCCGGLELALRLGILPNAHHRRLRVDGNPAVARHRLLILGDSFINKRGGGREAGHLANILSEELVSRDVAVLNTATSGTGPFEYRANMQSTWPDFKPNVVLLSYYTGNDLTNVKHHRIFDADGKHGKSGIGINTDATSVSLRSLYLYQFLRNQLRPFLLKYYHVDYDAAAAAGVAPELIEEARSLTINPWVLKLAVHHKNFLLDNALVETEENLEAWGKVRELISEIHDLCLERRAQLVVVTFPQSIQVNRSHFDFYERLSLHLDERTLYSARPQELMQTLCEERGIPHLDLLPIFRERPEEELYLEKDPHLNADGNRLSGERIFEFLLAETVLGSE